MSEAKQLEFPFPSLDFPGRQTLNIDEIAAKLDCTTQHVLDLAQENQFTGLDLRSRGANRRFLKIPIESYRDFIISRMTGPRRRELLSSLPKSTLRALMHDLKEALAA